MDILVVTDSKAIAAGFSGLEGKKSPHAVRFYPRADLKKALKSAGAGTLLYLDVDRYTAAERAKALKLAMSCAGTGCGVLDPKGAVKDVAELFHLGACDYAGKEILKEGITAGRIRRITDFRPPCEAKAAAAESSAAKYILSGDDWSAVKQGGEYTFCFMFIELDHQKELRRHMGESHVGKATETFRKYIERSVAPLGGRIWMWMDFGGLILFPFNGKKCEAIQAAARLMLAAKVMSAEESDFNSLLSYRIALHLGNTVYKSRGDTGTIISDSINSIFHLGQKYAQPGNFCITADIFPFMTEGLSRMFVPAGAYEGREIMRMRKVL